MKLTDLAFWPAPAVRALAAHWIEEADQLVAIAVQGEQGLRGLAEAAGIPVESMQDLVNRTRQSLGADSLRAAEAPVDVDQYGRGALPPETQDP